jgi:hypothetical protein
MSDSKWFFLAVLGVVLNGAGLCLFGDAVIHRMLQPDALNAWFWSGTFSLVLINAGICCIVEAAKWKGR